MSDIAMHDTYDRLASRLLAKLPALSGDARPHCVCIAGGPYASARLNTHTALHTKYRPFTRRLPLLAGVLASQRLLLLLLSESMPKLATNAA